MSHFRPRGSALLFVRNKKLKYSSKYIPPHVRVLYWRCLQDVISRASFFFPITQRQAFDYADRLHHSASRRAFRYSLGLGVLRNGEWSEGLIQGLPHIRKWGEPKYQSKERAMADFEMCYGKAAKVIAGKVVTQSQPVCPKRHSCKRYTAAPSFHQSYGLNNPMDGSCKIYIKNEL